MDSQAKVKVKILSDDSTATDAFGGHSRIAHAIVDLVNSQKNGKSIAIIGSWGSGKSSIVKMMGEMTDQSTRLFIFDAWEHEDDPLRRAFLEQLTSELNEWIRKKKKKKWKKKKRNLARREVRSKEYTIPSLKWAGLIFSVLLLLVPIGVVLVSASDELNSTEGILGLACAAAPFAFAFLMVPINAIKYSCKRVFRKQTHREAKSCLTGDLSSFFDKAVTKENVRTTETPDPTSIEFQKYYRGFLDETLRETSRRLVIVVDNLDRVDRDSALKIWATMRTFLELDGDQSSAVQDRIWLIVPFDQKALTRLWIDNPEHKLKDSFRDKAFQIVFRVPPPVLTDWKEFFLEMLQEAFHGFTDSAEMQVVYRVYERKGREQGVPPTPRDIKTFINSMVALYSIWGSQVSLRILALCAALQARGWDSSNLLGDQLENIVKKLPLDTNLATLQGKVAAVFLNRPESTAMQVLLRAPIQDAIDNHSYEKLGELSSRIGFGEEFERAVAERSELWAKEEPQTIGLFANQIDEFEDLDKYHSRNLWSYLRTAAREVTAWPQLSEDIAAGLAKLIRRYPDDKYLCEKVAKSLSNSVDLLTAKGADRDEYIDASRVEPFEAAVLGLCTVIDAMRMSESEEILVNQFRPPAKEAQYNHMMRILVQDDRRAHLLRYFQPPSDLDGIIGALSKDVENGTVTEADLDLVKSYQQFEVEWPWHMLAESISTRLKAVQEIEPGELTTFLRILLTFEEKEYIVAEVLEGHVNQGHICHHFSKIDTESQVALAAACLYVMIEHSPSLKMTLNHGNATDGSKRVQMILDKPSDFPAIVEEFTELFFEFNELDRLFEYQNSNKNLKQLVRQVLRTTATHEGALDRISLDALIRNNYLFRNAFDHERNYNAYIAKYVQGTDLVNRLISDVFDVQLSSLYQACFRAVGKSRVDFRNFLLKGVRSVSIEEWNRELDASYTYLSYLVVVMVEAGVRVFLKAPFFDALVSVRDRYIRGEQIESPFPKAIWPFLLKALDKSHRDTFLIDTIEQLLRKDEYRVRAIELLEGTLIQPGILDEFADEIIRKLSNLLSDSCSLQELSWFKQVICKRGKMAGKARRASVEVLKTRLADCYAKELDMDRVAILEPLAKCLGVRLPKRTLPGEADSE